MIDAADVVWTTPSKLTTEGLILYSDRELTWREHIRMFLFRTPDPRGPIYIKFGDDE